MRFPFFIAKRYMIAKKSHTAINLISGISMAGVAVGTMALLVILSVFNGFDSLVQTLFNAFDPDLKITVVEGKVFNLDSKTLQKIKKTEGVNFVTQVLEEDALLKYRDHQIVATIKGIDGHYFKVTGLDSLLEEGKFKADSGIFHYAMAGRGIAANLDIGINLFDPLWIYVPKRTKEINLNPQESFNSKYVFPTAVFSIDQDVDSKYLIVSINFIRDLLDYKKEISALEIKTKNEYNIGQIQRKIKKFLPSNLTIKNRYEQQELFYKIMKSEKWAIFFILVFIIIVASFNIISSLTMLVIDKKKDIITLNSLGTNWPQIRNIFFFEGIMISGVGALIGMIGGVIICWLQIHFHLVKLQGSGSFIIDYYPVILKQTDAIVIFLTVLLIGLITAWVPSRLITQKYFKLEVH